ncbi:hypothetical protein CsatB_007532 [Cannabis sativa]
MTSLSNWDLRRISTKKQLKKKRKLRRFLQSRPIYWVFYFKNMQSFTINEFPKPAEGERFYSGGHGRGRGCGSRGGYGGGYTPSNMAAPSIEDPGQFPSLGGK